MRALLFALLTVAFAFASAVSTPETAEASTAVRASSRGRGVAVAHAGGLGSAQPFVVRFAADGQTFANVDLGGGFVHDLLVTRDDALVMALSDAGRTGAVRIVRVTGRGRREVTIAGTSAEAEYHLVEAGSRIWLIHEGGGYRSVDSAASFSSAASWTLGSYGFHLASVMPDGQGVAFLSPHFESCHASDTIDGATLVRAPGTVTQRTLDLGNYPGLHRLWLGQGGVIYGAGWRDRESPDRSCAIVARMPAQNGQPARSVDVIRVPVVRWCSHHAASTARHTAASLERSVMRLEGDRAVPLGDVSGDIAAVYPDAQGRVLTLSVTAAGVHQLDRLSTRGARRLF